MLDADTLKKQASKLKRVDVADANAKSQTNQAPSQNALTSLLNAAFAQNFNNSSSSSFGSSPEDSNENTSWDDEEEVISSPELVDTPKAQIIEDDLITKLKKVYAAYKAEHPERCDVDTGSDMDLGWDDLSENPNMQTVLNATSKRCLPTTPSVLPIAQAAIQQNNDSRTDYDNLYNALFGDAVISKAQREDFDIFFEDAFGSDEGNFSQEEKATREWLRQVFWKLDSTLPLEQAQKKQADMQSDAISKINSFHGLHCKNINDMFLQLVQKIKEKQRDLAKKIDCHFDKEYAGKLSEVTKEKYITLFKHLYNEFPSWEISKFDFFFAYASQRHQIDSLMQLPKHELNVKYKQFMTSHFELNKYYDKYLDEKCHGDENKKIAIKMGLFSSFETRVNYINLYRAIFGSELPNDERMAEFNTFFNECNNDKEVSKVADMFNVFVNVDESMSPERRKIQQDTTLALISWNHGIECKSFRDVYEKIIPKCKKQAQESLTVNTNNDLHAYKLAQTKENKNINNTNNNVNNQRESLRRSR